MFSFGLVSCFPAFLIKFGGPARVVEWQTRTFEGRMPKGMRVQVPPRAPSFVLERAEERRMPRRNKVKAGCVTPAFESRSKDYALAGQHLSELTIIFFSIQGAREVRFSVSGALDSKIGQSAGISKSDSVSMPHRRKRRARPAKGSATRKEDGSTICALCGRTIKAGTDSNEEPVIYSICASCKRMPHRNAGSSTLLC